MGRKYGYNEDTPEPPVNAPPHRSKPSQLNSNRNTRRNTRGATILSETP